MKLVCSLLLQWFQTDKFDAMGLIGANKTVAGFHLGGLSGFPESREAALKLIQLYEEGAIKPRIDSVFSFAQVSVQACTLHKR